MAFGLARMGARGKADRAAFEAREVALRERASPGAPGIEAFELREPEPRAHIGKIEFPTGIVHVARPVGEALDAVETQRLGALRLVGRGEHRRAALDRGHVLVRMEAEGRDVAEGADGLSLPARSDGEAGVLDDAHAPLLREREETIHVARQAPEMRGNDGAG